MTHEEKIRAAYPKWLHFPDAPSRLVQSHIEHSQILGRQFNEYGEEVKQPKPAYERTYKCGCKASGPTELPDYCPDHYRLPEPSDEPVRVSPEKVARAILADEQKREHAKPYSGLKPLGPRQARRAAKQFQAAVIEGGGTLAEEIKANPEANLKDEEYRNSLDGFLEEYLPKEDPKPAA